MNVFPVGKKFDKAKNKWSKFPKTNGNSWLTYEASAEELSASSNVGIIIPAGVIVIDMDTDKGVTHDDIENGLGCKLNWEDAVLQKTVSGGYHYGFLVSEDLEMLQGSNLLGVTGFDTRTSGKGWICSGDGYTAQGMDDVINILEDASEWLPTLPIEAVKKLTGKKKESTTDFDDLESAIASETLDITIDEMRVHLFALESNYYENESDWYQVGMAIYHQTRGSEQGYTLFDEFSKRGESTANYDEQANRRRWDLFDGKTTENPITFASVIYWADADIKKKEVIDYVISDVIMSRIESEFKRGACGVSFEPNLPVIKLMLKNTYYTCAAKTFFKMFNQLGQVIRVGKNEIASTILENFGQPINNFNELSMAVECDEDMTAAVKKQILSSPVNIIVRLLMEFQQRERITQCVDIFAEKAHMDIKKSEVIESLKYEPMIIEHELYNEDIVAAYEAHFPELYEVLDMIIASRFASSRKKCYLWINASSDWGKDLFRVCLGERAMEMSVTQIGKAIKGETVSVHIDDIVGTFALCVNEFSHINSEIKQIENSLVIAPKYMNQSTIPTYTKLFFSADDVDSLVGEYGVESQFNNRFSMLSYTGSISDLAIFNQVGQYTFTHVLKTHVANYINENVQTYINKGLHEASIVADKVVTGFHTAHTIGNLVGDFDSSIEALANTVKSMIRADHSSEFLPQHENDNVYTRPNAILNEILFKIGGRSEVKKLTQKRQEILEFISVEGVKVYRTEEGLVKGFKLKPIESVNFTTPF